MTRADIIREYIRNDISDIDRFDMVLCERCIDAIKSRGEKIITTDDCVIDGWDLEEFITYGGLDDAEDGNEPCGCEWCEELDTLYGVIWR